jgi:formate dehydrogenase major subunit
MEKKMSIKQNENNIIKIHINEKEVETSPGKTILQTAFEQGIHIPHLCSDVRLQKNEGQCGICVVEIKNEDRFVQACNTRIQDGMEILINSPKVEDYRRVRLEQILSQHNADCVAPCVSECPAHIDIQTYLRQVVNGNFRGALRVIKDKNPFPITCGRVCPHPCEAKCRRGLVDSSIAINYVKRFVADIDISSENPYVHKVKEPTGKRIAIIGAGPAGLSAAYYSAINGHDVTVFDKNYKPGGMLRYGIPEYRLPKALLDKEIDIIKKLGVKIQSGKSLGVHVRLEDLQQDFDSTFLAVGSCTANPMKLEGDRARGVWLGIYFLERITRNVKMDLGDEIVVFGGGNTAIDCARTALRMAGVKKVHLVYRRTKDEMPAEQYEVEEALEEGVQMHFLISPTKIDFDIKSRKVTGIHCMKMELGPPDRSGRRRPIPIENSEDIFMKATGVIGAIGQSTDTSFLWDDLPLKRNRWGDVEINGKTMETSENKIFSGGDCVTGPATAIQAVAAGRQAAISMNDFINKGYVHEAKENYSCSRGTLEDLPRYEFMAMPKIPRVKMPKMSVEERIQNNKEVETGLTREKAIEEASRCLKCGCNERSACMLRDEATAHKIEHKKPLRDISFMPITEDHPFIVRDHNKCISCGLCVTLCKDFVGAAALEGYIQEGKLRIGTSNGSILEKTDCVSCGQCVTACPCGALDYRREGDLVFQALNDPKKTVIGFVAPAVRSVIASHYGLKYDEAMPFLAGVLKSYKLGFDKIFDFSFAADLTIMEETSEFLNRVGANKNLPHFTSCCPGWVNFVERRYPELINHLSSCKSPQQMMGSTVKSHYLDWANIKDKKDDVFVVSIVPCIAKKYEAARKEFVTDGNRDVDAVLTTTELLEMIKRTKVNMDEIEPQEYDEPYKHVSGAGILFGVSGGVSEATLRLAVEKLSTAPLEDIDFKEARGLEGIKEVQVEAKGQKVKIAVISGLKNVEPILEQMKAGIDVGYDLIEVMCCPGGCIDGAGHPKPEDTRELTHRKEILMQLDKTSKIRKSQDNPDILNLYKQFFKEPGSSVAHDYLHTSYSSKRNEVSIPHQERSKSTHPVKEIAVCVDKHCFKKGSVDVLNKLNHKIMELGLDQFVKVKPQLCQGHCEDKDVFISIDGKRVPIEIFDDIETFFINQFLS